MNFNKYDKRIIRRNTITLVIAIVLIVSLMNIEGILKLLGKFWAIIYPFILGMAIAFIINIPMNIIEKNLLEKLSINNKSLKRALAIILSLILIFGLLIILLVIAIPQLINSIIIVIKQMPIFIEETLNFIRSYEPIAEYADKIEVFLEKIDLQKLGQMLLEFLSDKKNLVGSVGGAFSRAINIVSGFTNFFISLVFAIYCLASKEKVIRQAKEIVYSFFREDHGDKIVHVATVFRANFNSFFTGQFLEAVILGTLCFIGMMILQLPFAPLVSTIIGFGALIPIFGAIIAAFIGAFIILIKSPIQALVFLIYIIILQQLDGNFVYPRIVGKQVGLPAMWVLAAITIGGAIHGVIGMLIYVPIASTIYFLLREFKNRMLKEKNINIDEK